MSWTHEHSWKLEAAPERVFRALTDSALLTKWFAERALVDAKTGGRYRFWGRHTLGLPSEKEADQAFTRFEPGRALGFTWTLFGVPTEVSIELAAEGESTRLTLHHSVQGDLPLPRPRELIHDHWLLAFGNLAAYLAEDGGIVLPDYGDPNPEIRMTITIDAPPTEVFRALIEPEMVNKWFGTSSAVVEPRPGGRYELGWKYQVDGRDVTGGPTVIKEIVPNEILVLDWPDWRGDKSVSGQWIAFYLEPAGSSTKLTFVHGGFGRAADFGDYPFGWAGFLGELKTAAAS